MFSFFFVLTIVLSKSVSCYNVVLSGSEDVIEGGTAEFVANVYDENGILSSSEFIFIWSDNASPSNNGTLETKSPASWNITYNNPPAVYNITVKVKKDIIIIKPTIGTAYTSIRVTKFLLGDIVLTQGNYSRKKYVSNEMPVNHTVLLKKHYFQYLKKTKNYFRTYWFVDCVYYGLSSGFEFDFNYTKSESIHFVEALLVATFIPNLPKDNEKYFLNDKVVLSSKNNSLEHLNMTQSVFSVSSSEENNTEFHDFDKKMKSWLIQYNSSLNLNNSKSSGYCLNSSLVPLPSKYTFGFFKTNLTVKTPVKISPINGTNWLMDGEVLNISVSCNGSSPYAFCVLLKPGLYNKTGNETCNEETVVRNCSFGIQHLFKKPSEYTLVVIISNAVSRVIKPIAVNIYKVKKHAQLSVIIVPVSFSLIATILIIFGVAYYVQSKHKYTIEVADFDFGNQTSNMEYKSFRERLRESISNSFLKSNDYLDNDSSWSETAPTSRKYGSMQ